MVESTSHSKPIVLAMGTLGVGKSTVLNRILGSAKFECSDRPTGVTQDFAAYETADFTILDTPGLNDMDMLLPTWAAKLNASPYRNQPVALVLMCLRAKIRPSTEDRNNIQVMLSAIKDLNAKNVCDVITFVDESPETYTKPSQMAFLQFLYKHCQGVDCPAESNVFLFKGEAKSGVEATDQ